MREHGYTQNCAHSERASEQSVTGLSELRVQHAKHDYDYINKPKPARRPPRCAVISSLQYTLQLYICSNYFPHSTFAQLARGRDAQLARGRSRDAIRFGRQKRARRRATQRSPAAAGAAQRGEGPDTMWWSGRPNNAKNPRNPGVGSRERKGLMSKWVCSCMWFVS